MKKATALTLITAALAPAASASTASPIAPALTASATASLTPDSIQPSVDLGEVVVSATRADSGTPMAYANVGKEELRKNNFGQDVPYLVAQTPSVVVTSDGGAGIGYTSYRVRGTDANRINVTVNGVPINDSESQTVFWVNMPDFASSVESVQVQRGAGTSTNGSGAFGATIAMQTQRAELRPYAEVRSAAGSFGTLKTTLRGGTGLIADRWAFDVRYSRLHSDGFIDRSGADLSSWFASAAWYGGSSMVRYQAFGSSERTLQAWNYVPSDSIRAGNRTFNSCGRYTQKDAAGNDLLDSAGNPIYAWYDQTDNYRQQHHHLTFARELSRGWNLNATLHYTHGSGYYEDYKERASLAAYLLDDFQAADGSAISRTDLVRRKWLRNDFYGLVANAAYSGNRLRSTLGGGLSNYDGRHDGNVIWARSYAGLSPDHRYYHSDATKLEYNIFGKLTYSLTRQLSAFADLQLRGIRYRTSGTTDNFGYDGLQQELDIDRRFLFFNPKVGLSASLGGGHSLFASLAVANREPNRTNFTDAGPDEYPMHETMRDYELGYNFATPRFSLGLNFYFMDYDNQLILTGKLSEIGEALTSNIKDSYRAGIELSASAHLCGWLDWKGNIALSRNKIRRFTETVDLYDNVALPDGSTSEEWVGTREVYYRLTDIAMSPGLVANSAFNLRLGAFTAELSTAWVGRQYLDNTSCRSRSLSPYSVSSLQLGYTLRPRFVRSIDLGVRVGNLFNSKYESNGWVYSYINEASGHGNDNRAFEDGRAAQCGTNVMASLGISF